MNNSVAIDISAGAQDKEIPYKPFPLDSKHEPQPHGEHIDLLEVSPNGKYLVTYNKENQTIVGWNIVEEEKDDDMKEGKSKSVKVKKDIPVNLDKEVRHLCVSNQKILAYIYYDDDIGNW